MKKCYATKNNGKPCFANVNHPKQFCHIHDPNGKFRKQLKAKGMGKGYTPRCNHKWYMREPGIQCVNCLVVWEKDERA